MPSLTVFAFKKFVFLGAICLVISSHFSFAWRITGGGRVLGVLVRVGAHDFDVHFKGLVSVCSRFKGDFLRFCG